MHYAFVRLQSTCSDLDNFISTSYSLIPSVTSLISSRFFAGIETPGRPVATLCGQSKLGAPRNQRKLRRDLPVAMSCELHFCRQSMYIYIYIVGHSLVARNLKSS